MKIGIPFISLASICGCIRTLVLGSVLLYPGTLFADQVSLEISDKISALAEYHNPDSDLPAILILHGFLQTYHFSTVQYIATELIDNDYPVLTPNLSLGLNKRDKSLNCEAIHNHNSQDGNHEIDRWIEWLVSRGHKQVILIGHSTGGSQLVSYTANKPNASVIALIALSLGPIWSSSKTKNALMDMASAKQQIKTDPDAIQKYTLGFCNRTYTAPARAFLSYMRWSERFTLNSIENSNVPVHVVLGEQDNFLPLNWAAKVRTRTSNVKIIPKADHFFSGDSEFLIQETVLSLIGEISGQHQGS